MFQNFITLFSKSVTTIKLRVAIAQKYVTQENHCNPYKCSIISINMLQSSNHFSMKKEHISCVPIDHSVVTSNIGTQTICVPRRPRDTFIKL